MKTGDLVEVVQGRGAGSVALVVGIVDEDNPRIAPGHHRFALVKWLRSGRVERFDKESLEVLQ